MGAGLGLDELNPNGKLGDGDEFQGLGLSCVVLLRAPLTVDSEFLQSLNDNAPYLSSLGALPHQVSPGLHPVHATAHLLSPAHNPLDDPSVAGILEGLAAEGAGASFGRRETAGSGSGLAGIERGATAREVSGSGALTPPVSKCVLPPHDGANGV